ncbi:MAG: PAS domain S-box protein [Desulfobacteraceae bacterium]|nr:MAG: PAS domain S-box protein [Desulfobacteraceae bacterium]
MENTDTEINNPIHLFREAFESASDPILVTIQQKIVLINHSFEKLLGWTKDEIIGKDFTDYTLDSKPLQNYVKGLARKKTDDFYSAKLKGKHGPVDVSICSTKVYINGRYGRLAVLK